MKNNSEGIDLAKIANWLLTLALIGLIVFLVARGGIVRERLVVVETCNNVEVDRNWFDTQEEYDEWEEGLDIVGGVKDG